SMCDRRQIERAGSHLYVNGVECRAELCGRDQNNCVGNEVLLAVARRQLEPHIDSFSAAGSEAKGIASVRRIQQRKLVSAKIRRFTRTRTCIFVHHGKVVCSTTGDSRSTVTWNWSAERKDAHRVRNNASGISDDLRLCGEEAVSAIQHARIRKLVVIYKVEYAHEKFPVGEDRIAVRIVAHVSNLETCGAEVNRRVLRAQWVCQRDHRSDGRKTARISGYSRVATCSRELKQACIEEKRCRYGISNAASFRPRERDRSRGHGHTRQRIFSGCRGYKIAVSLSRVVPSPQGSVTIRIRNQIDCIRNDRMWGRSRK